MTIEQVLEILRNRVSNNALQRAQAVQRGDIDAVGRLDQDTATTEQTIAAILANVNG